MGLQFKLKEEDGERFIDIDAQAGDGQNALIINLQTGDEWTNFEALDSEDLLPLAIFINHKIGYDLFNKYEIERQIEKDKEYWEEQKKQS